MCGIVGCIGSDRPRIERMLNALLHRGPDGHFLECIDEQVTLGHARLSILDPSPAGAQPFWNDRRTHCIVFNGEIYNFRELRHEEGFSARTGTDTEILLQLFERYGTSFLPRLHGMFAFAIYTVADRSLTLVRDESGIKPLFIAFPEGRFCFASEMRSLLRAFPVRPALNMQSLSRYLRLQYVPGPDTMCIGIENVAPGSVLTWRDGRLHRSSYTSHVSAPLFRSRADFIEGFPEVMDRVVHAEMVSDRPLGLFLSGGMDSSVLLHHMAKHSSGPVRTLTVRFEATEAEGAARFNLDADFAARTAAVYGAAHTEILLTADLFRHLYAEASASLDQPNSDHVSVAQFLLAREAKKTVDVVLCGAGGDELFGGYPRYRIAKVLHALRWIPPSLRAVAGDMIGHPSDVLRLAPDATLLERLLCRPMCEWQGIVRGTWFDACAASEILRKHFVATAGLDPVRRCMEVDRRLWLVDESLKLVDGTSMASGVEARVPFLASMIRHVSAGLPSSCHVSFSETKVLLKRTYASLLPSHLFKLRKASFYPPLAKWLRRESAPLLEEALAEPKIQELFDADALRTLFDAHRTRRTYALHVLHGVVQLSAWLRNVYCRS